MRSEQKVCAYQKVCAKQKGPMCTRQGKHNELAYDGRELHGEHVLELFLFSSD